MFVFQLRILLLFWMCIQGSFNNRALLLLHFTLLTCCQSVNSVNRNNFSGQFELTICAEDIPASECQLPMQLYQMCYFHQYLLTKRPSFWLSCCTQTALLHKSLHSYFRNLCYSTLSLFTYVMCYACSAV